MLPKRLRLPRTAFSLRPTRTASFLFGSLRFIPGEPRVSVVVSKKVAVNAADRNALRRRVYAVIRNLVPRLNDSLIIYLNKNARGASAGDLRKAIAAVLPRSS